MTRFTSDCWRTRFQRGQKVGSERPAAQPKPRREVAIDTDALAAAKAKLTEQAAGRVPIVAGGSNRLPATGECHECERPVSGERRFCGPCMSKRRP